MRKLLYGRDCTHRKGDPLLSVDPPVVVVAHDVAGESSASNSIPVVVPHGSRRVLEITPLGETIENGGYYSSFSTEGTNPEKLSVVPPPTSGWRWGRVVLFLLAMVYGSLNVSMRLVFARPDPPTASVSSAVQGWFTVFCFLPLLGWQTHHHHKPPLALDDQKTTTIAQEHSNKNNKVSRFPHGWRFALELALWNFGTQALINTSLVWTQGARASFLVQTSVVWTPLLSVWIVPGNTKNQQPGRRQRRITVWCACALALAGLWVLSRDGETTSDEENKSSTSTSTTAVWGDTCCLMAALCWSVYICRLSALGDFYDETTTQFTKNIVLAIFYTIWMLLSLVLRNDNNNNNVSSLFSWTSDLATWGILFYTALGPCTIADVWQQKAQASIPAAETNVILSLEPVFTTLLGFVLLGEKPSRCELGGGALILVASFLAAGCGTSTQASQALSSSPTLPSMSAP